MNLVELLRTAAQAVATLVEAVGVVVVAVAVLRAGARYVAGLLARAQPFPPEGLRLGLGRSLALSLEFLLGADILRTAVEPSWDEIGRLAAIATIRTALNYFLQREIAEDARMFRNGHDPEAMRTVLGAAVHSDAETRSPI
ncbi:MAG: DUF1622 domain-containing protein [Chloroflexota bacterium]|nr:DUF1622 domain-containing protein [Chloroflexota bacterium]